jgi:hypothetical protein
MMILGLPERPLASPRSTPASLPAFWAIGRRDVRAKKRLQVLANGLAEQRIDQSSVLAVGGAEATAPAPAVCLGALLLSCQLFLPGP